MLNLLNYFNWGPIVKSIRFYILAVTLVWSCQENHERPSSRLKFSVLNRYVVEIGKACQSNLDPDAIGRCISEATLQEIAKNHRPTTIVGTPPLVDPAVKADLLDYVEEFAPELLDEVAALTPRQVDKHLALMEEALNKHPDAANHGTVLKQTLFRLDSRSPHDWGGRAYMAPNKNKSQKDDLLPLIHLNSGGSSTWISTSGSMQINPEISNSDSLPATEKAKLVGDSNLSLLSDKFFLPPSSICFVNKGDEKHPKLELCDRTVVDGKGEYYLVYITNQYIAKQHNAFLPEVIFYPEEWEALALTFQPNAYKKVIGTARVKNGETFWTGAFTSEERAITYEYLDEQETTSSTEADDNKKQQIAVKSLGRWDATLGKPTTFQVMAAAILCGVELGDNLCCDNFVKNVEKLKID